MIRFSIDINALRAKEIRSQHDCYIGINAQQVKEIKPEQHVSIDINTL